MLSLCKEIVIFLILAKILESFEAGKKYGKFVKLIISLIVVLQIIHPVVSFFRGDFEITAITKEIEERITMDKEQIDSKATEYVDTYFDLSFINVEESVQENQSVYPTDTDVDTYDMQYKKVIQPVEIDPIKIKGE